MLGSKRGRRLVSVGLIASLVLMAVLMASPADASVSGGAASQRTSPPGQGEVRLVGPQRVVVRELPSPPLPALGAPSERTLPRHIPPLAADAAPGSLAPAPAANAVDPAFSAQAQSQTPPTVSAATFEGLDNNDNAALTSFTVTPPDPQVAVGPNHVFEMINIVGRIYSRTGGAVQTFTLASFFQVPAGYQDTDPKIIYDSLSGRWFASYVSLIDNPGRNNDQGRLHLAISQTSDPTGAWNIYYATYSQLFPDYAGIGVTNDKFTVSSNIFDISLPFYYGEQTIVIEKADVLAGLPAASVGLFSFPFNLSRFTVRPAHSLSSVNDQYLVTGASSTALTLIRITGTPDAGNVAEASATNLTMLAQNSPPASATAANGSIDSGDDRLLDAMWRDGRLWTSASAACVPPGDSTTRSCAHLIEVDTGVNSVTQDIMFGAAGEYYSWPAVRTDAEGNVYVSLTHTNSTIFAEARAAGRLASEPPNTMTGSALLRAGDVLHTSSRWGDYQAAAVDPKFPRCVWLVGEYAKSTLGADWGTFIAATSYGGGCDSDNDGWTDAAEAIIGTSPVLACGTNAWPADINNDTFVDVSDISAVAASFGQSVPPASARLDIAPDPPDGGVDIADLARVAALFGRQCT